MQLGSEEEMQQRLASMPVHHSMRGLFFNSVLGVLAYVNEAGGVRAIAEHLAFTYEQAHVSAHNLSCSRIDSSKTTSLW